MCAICLECYTNARVLPRQGQPRRNWCQQQTHRVQEVFYLRYNWDEARQVFPPKGPCECSLCRPVTRIDRQYLHLVNDEKPDSLDYNKHETLFKHSRELWRALRLQRRPLYLAKVQVSLTRNNAHLRSNYILYTQIIDSRVCNQMSL